MDTFTLCSITMLIGGVLLFPVMKKREKQRRMQNEYYDLNRKLFEKGIDSNNRKTIKENLIVLKHGYEEIESFLSANSRNCYMDDINELQEHLDEVEEDEWSQKADKILDTFFDLFDTITQTPNDYQNIDIAHRAKEKCLTLWHQYWDSINAYHFTLFPKKHMREYLGNRYSPCMENKQELVKTLDRCIEETRPEYVRKNIIFEKLLSIVATKGNVMRCELITTKINDYTLKEVEGCYQVLVKSKQLLEYKVRGRFYVCLSDKESQKRIKQVQKIKANVSRKKADYTKDEFLALLKRENLLYVDKSEVGGALWVIDRKGNQKLFHKVTVDGVRIRYADSTRHFNKSPGWYVKA